MFARVPAALSPAWRTGLLREIDDDGFEPAAEQVGAVRQRVDQLVVSLDDQRYPVTARLAAVLGSAVGDWAPRLPGSDRFIPNEGVYLRYRGSAAGIGPHRDHRRYLVVIAVFTLVGEAPFAIVGDRAGNDVRASWLTFPGDLVLLQAPGLVAGGEGRPLHTVGPCVAGERICLTLRMDARAAG